jgi:hypothetical protein
MSKLQELKSKLAELEAQVAGKDELVTRTLRQARTLQYEIYFVKNQIESELTASKER